VDVLTKDPCVLKRHKLDSAIPPNKLVRSIILEARYGRYTKNVTLEEEEDEDCGCSGSYGASEFNFKTLVEPEYWANLLPVHKDTVAATTVTKPGGSLPILNFPPPVMPPTPPESASGDDNSKSKEADGGDHETPAVNPNTGTEAAAPEGATLAFHAAVFGKADVTPNILALVNGDEKSLSIDTARLSEEGIPNSDLETLEALSIVFEYSDNRDDSHRLYALVVAENSGKYELKPTSELPDPPKISRVGINPRRDGTAFYIVAVVYGDKVTTAPDLYDRVYAQAQSREPFTVGVDFIGEDPWVGISKTLAVFYQVGGPGEPIKVTTGQDGESMSFNWEEPTS